MLNPPETHLRFLLASIQLQDALFIFEWRTIHQGNGLMLCDQLRGSQRSRLKRIRLAPCRIRTYEIFLVCNITISSVLFCALLCSSVLFSFRTLTIIFCALSFRNHSLRYHQRHLSGSNSVLDIRFLPPISWSVLLMASSSYSPLPISKVRPSRSHSPIRQ